MKYEFTLSFRCRLLIYISNKKIGLIHPSNAILMIDRFVTKDYGRVEQVRDNILN
jgi:hypothetical protein